MINWDKPIETMDGSRARLIQTNASEPGIWHMVHVLGGPGRYGDVFIVNDEGYRCDDRSVYSNRQEPFIRNVPVKREGWVLVEPKKNWTSDGSIVAILGTRYVYPTEQEALRAKECHNMDLETKAVPFEWEE